MSLKVLSVDDSKTIRMIVRKAFSPFDCVLTEAENGIEGLACAAKERPDLIILDITMPIMNGIEMLSKLRGEPQLSAIPVIMLTAESGKDKVMEILKLGVKNYIVKPFKGEQLIEKAQTMVKLEPKVGEGTQKSGGHSKWFALENQIQRLTVPDKVDRVTLIEIEGAFHARMKEMLNSGVNRLILDLSRVKEINVALIKLLISVIRSCQSSNIKMRIVGNPSLDKDLKELKETSEVPIDSSLEDARAAL